MKTIVTTNVFRKIKIENMPENYPIVIFSSKVKAKKWFKKLKEIEKETIGKTKLYNKGETLVTEGKFSTFVRTIWTEKEYNKLKAINKNF